MKIVIIGGARDYHVMDWFYTVSKLSKKEVFLLTDLLSGEGYKKIYKKDDKIYKLFIIDNLLFKKQSRFGDIWRNIVKILVLPIQIFHLKQFDKSNDSIVYHAQPMYYMLLCYLCGLNFIGTPQGSEILVRPNKSSIYKYFAKKILRSAKTITVDSRSMYDEILKISGVKSLIIQNGIEIEKILNTIVNNNKDKILSIRGMTDLYRINEIVEARDQLNNEHNLNFIFPFVDKDYLQKIEQKINVNDNILGRLTRDDMIKEMKSSFLVLSIPKSDSSPRSVYESIFSGACVAVAPNKYIEDLPECMQKRLFIVDFQDKFWLEKAIQYAKAITMTEYKPSKEAIDMFDQNKSMQIVIDKIYK
jgi:hypothetical protein